MFYSIKSKLILTVTIFLALTALFIFLYFPPRYEQIQLEALSENAAALNNLIAYSLSPAIYFEDEDNINEVISGAQQNKNIEYLMILGTNGMITGYNHYLAEKCWFRDLNKLFDIENSVYKTEQTIIHNNKIIGHLYVGYDLAEINKQIHNARFAITLISIFLFLTGSIIIYIVIRYSFKTLTEMVKVTKRISSGDLSLRAAESGDEIGEVAETFNQMMNELENSHNKLKLWNSELESLVKERTADLENEIEERKKTEIELVKAKELAEEMNRLKSSFLANMSHELRTPMIGILGYSDILEAESGEKETRELAALIKKSGKRLHNTLNQVLDLSKTESEKNRIILKITDIVELTEECITLYKAAAFEKGLNLLFKNDFDSVYASIEQSLFINMMNNLLNNAVKYTQEGEITVSLNIEGELIILKVSDTGVGIPEEMIKIIFEPFRQVSEGYGRLFDGTGLGLTLVQKYLEIMNGKIEVESRLNYGSVFRVFLPLVKQPVQKTYPDKIIAGNGRMMQTEKKIKILLVEDDEICINTIGLYLKGQFELDVLSDAESAIEIINKKEYDLFLFDINLKGNTSGLQLIYELRQTDLNRNKPAIAVTAYAMKGDRENFINAGFTDYLAKPFYKADLLNLIYSVIDTVQILNQINES